MIIKSFEINKIKINKNNFILLYGHNEGFKNEITDHLLKNKTEIKRYEEKEILDNPENFIELVISQSLFDSEKIIIIKRVTDKLIKIVEELANKDLQDVIIIFNSNNLEKKSKIRSFFEKDKRFVCVPFYADTKQTLSKLALNFFREKNISISSLNINLVIDKCNGDRQTLFNEINKLAYFNKRGKKINEENIAKLINLIENHNANELVDNCLSMNKKKVTDILNENNFSNEDCIIIIRSFLSKTKKILKLSSEFKENNNIDLTISSARPPIFWKDKEITKQQIYKWTPDKIKNLIYKLSSIELLIKQNFNNSVNLITDFIINLTSSNTSN